MKKVIWFLFTILTVLSSCTKNETGNTSGNNYGADVKHAVSSICTDWGASEDDVISKMGGLQHTADGDILIFADLKRSLTYTYRFSSSGLCSAAIIAPDNGTDSGAFMKSFISYGFIEDSEVLFSSSKNSMCAVYSKAFDDNRYQVIGFTPVESDDFPPVEQLQVTINPATDIENYTAKVSGSVVNNNGYVACGLEYTIHQDFPADRSISMSSRTNGHFSFTLEHLDKETKYYYRAYAVENNVYIFSQTGTFTTTNNLTGEENGHGWVDLDLPSGTLWATTNLGASSPEKDGDYYRWAETTPNHEWTISSYKYYGGKLIPVMSKYVTDRTSDYYDGRTELELSDDAARYQWGGRWRIPSKDEWTELLDADNCTWSANYLNGMKGYTVTSTRNKQSIFFPLQGYYVYQYVNLQRYLKTSYYWARNLYGGTNGKYDGWAYHTYMSVEYGEDHYLSSSGSREDGFPIRPVIE